MSKEYDFFKHKTFIKETSYDDAQNQYMTESDLEVIDFDKVKEEYIENLKLTEPPKSCDSLFFLDSNKKVFIEFKNGKVELFDVRKKIYDSILIYSDLTQCGISKTREEIKYILVYNYDANKNNRSYISDSSRNIQETEGFKVFSDFVSKNAKKPILRFKLNDFKNYLVKNIYTYTSKEFEENFIKNFNSETQK